MKKVDKTLLKNVKAIDLFCGIGGFRYAIASFGGEVVFASEADKKTANIYAQNFGFVPNGDITTIDENTIPDHDILCAGFPCQPFSISGKQQGFEDTRGTLFFDIARIAKAKQPKILLLENVYQLEAHDSGNTFSVISSTMESIGYDVYYKIMNSADYGFPQSRKRIYIVCLRKDMGITSFEFPMPSADVNHKYVKDILCKADTDNYVISRSDITINTDDSAAECTDKPFRIGSVAQGRQGERIYSAKGKAITLTANGGGIGGKCGLYKIDGKIRKLTPRECARLQGFPESFKIPISDNLAYSTFGNAVDVCMIQLILQAMVSNADIMKHLKNT